MNRIIREATPTDMAAIMQVMDAAKKGETHDVDNIVRWYLMWQSGNILLQVTRGLHIRN